MTDRGLGQRERLFARYVDSATSPEGEYAFLPLTEDNMVILRMEFERLSFPRSAVLSQRGGSL